MCRILPVRVLLLLAYLFILNACATLETVAITPPPLQHSGPEIYIADVDVLALSPAMEEFLERYILKYQNRHTRLNLLINAVSGIGPLGFDYDESLTLTAIESFDARAGNCIGFANMMIAMARRAGLNANYQEIIRRPEWASHEDTMLLIKHINVVIENAGFTYVVDVSGIKINPNMKRRIIKDNYAKALYWNNIGAEALLDNNLPKAHAYLSKAIETETRFTDSWVNLGVVFGRTDQLDDAALALQRALEINSLDSSAMSNLYEVYIAQEDLESAQALQKKVDKYRSRNPYYLLKLSDEALEEDRYEDSISLLKRAIRRQKNDHMLHFALAKTQYLSGEIAAAEGSLVRARELAPENMMVYYARPLDELVAEED